MPCSDLWVREVHIWLRTHVRKGISNNTKKKKKWLVFLPILYSVTPSSETSHVGKIKKIIEPDLLFFHSIREDS